MAETITIRGIWGGMTDETAATILGDVKRETPDLYREAIAKTAGAFRMRPEVLRTQPLPRQAASIRRALTQVTQQDLGAHILIDWLTKTQKPMLIQFLSALGIAHEDGMVKEDVGPQPDQEALRAAVANLRSSFPPDTVRVYLQAFSVITAAEWEELPELIAEDPDRSAGAPTVTSAGTTSE
jgi:hypothetical protein